MNRGFTPTDTFLGGGATARSAGGASQNVPIPDTGAVDLDLAEREASNSSVVSPLPTKPPAPAVQHSLGTFVGPYKFALACGLTVAVLSTMS